MWITLGGNLFLVDKDYINKQLDAINKRKYSVAKSNNIIQQTATSLTLNEQRFVLIALSKIQKGDEADKEYKITIDDFCDILNIDKTTGGYLKPRLKKYLKKLSDNSIWYYDSNTREDKLIRWFTGVKIGRGIITYRFDPSVVPYIYNLKEYYTTYELWCILLLKTKNSIEMYEFLKSLANLRIAPVFEIEVLQAKFNVNYSTYAEFKRSFLLKTLEEINDKTDITVEFVEIKEGRKVTKLEFIINVLKNKDFETQYWAVESAIQNKQLLKSKIDIDVL